MRYAEYFPEAEIKNSAANKASASSATPGGVGHPKRNRLARGYVARGEFRDALSRFNSPYLCRSSEIVKRRAVYIQLYVGNLTTSLMHRECRMQPWMHC